MVSYYEKSGAQVPSIRFVINTFLPVSLSHTLTLYASLHLSKSSDASRLMAPIKLDYDYSSSERAEQFAVVISTGIVIVPVV